MTEDPAGRPGPAAMLIAHVSDLHIGAHVPDAVESLAADVTAARPALTVVTGDLTMRARPDQFAGARALLDRLPAPRLVLPGNHDIPLAPLPRLVSPFAAYRTRIAVALDPVVRLPGLCALGLNSMPRWRWKNGRVSRRQVDAVVDVLGGASRPTVRLLAMHHPPFAGRRVGLIGVAGLVDALVAARVDLLLAGHTHRPSVQVVELSRGATTHRVVETVAGTATSRRTRGTSRSWTAIRVDASTIAVEQRHHGDLGWHGGHTAVMTRQA